MSTKGALVLAALVLLMRPDTAPADSAIVRSPALITNGLRDIRCRLTNLGSITQSYILHGEPSLSCGSGLSGNLAAGESIEIACSGTLPVGAAVATHCEANAASNAEASNFLLTQHYQGGTHTDYINSSVGSHGNSVATL